MKVSYCTEKYCCTVIHFQVTVQCPEFNLKPYKHAPTTNAVCFIMGCSLSLSFNFLFWACFCSAKQIMSQVTTHSKIITSNAELELMPSCVI